MKTASNQDEFPIIVSNAVVPEFPENNVIYAANDNRPVSSFNEELTAEADRWPDPTGLKSILSFAAPRVLSDRYFDFERPERASTFLSELDDSRLSDHDFASLKYSGEKELLTLVNKGLCLVFDMDLLTINPVLEMVFLYALIATLYRQEFRRVISLLSAGAVKHVKTWNSGADPDSDVIAVLNTTETTVGIANNRLIFGKQASRVRTLALRATSGTGIASSASVHPSAMAPMFGVDEVVVSGHRFVTSPASRTRIVPSSVFGFYSEDNVTPFDPTHLKRFVREYRPGSELNVYRQKVSAKQVKLTVEMDSRIVCPMTDGLFEIQVSG
ncbi:MAG: hypothetical protein LLG06_17005 [Desulfobacteraceae bacterium]|nr:hypothetical protein [Desulfobacteraceae bacterium]